MDELIPIVAILCVIGLPMLGLVIRFALTPLVERMTEAIRGADREAIAELRARLAATEELVEVQQRELEQLADAERFHRELASDRSGQR